MEVGSRLSYRGSICTVRYIGPVPAWPDTTALGVEWDDASRGKHSGQLDAVKYFDTLVPHAGTFVKATRKQDPALTFDQALKGKYDPDVSMANESIHVSKTKVIENVGFEKFKREHQQFANLPIVSLSMQCVKWAGSSMKFELPSLKSLDLSNNLFESLDEICQICQRLPAVQSVVLNGNRLKHWKSDIVLDKVTQLSFSAALLTAEHVEVLARSFPDILDLTLANNNLDQMDVSHFSKLTTLDISCNKFEHIPETAGRIPTLNVSHNRISTITAPLPATQSINLSYNYLEDWTSLDKLMEMAPQLTSLRVNNNAILPDSQSDPLVIGRCEGIVKLNGVSITPRGRVDAELWFMSKVSDSTAALPKPRPQRWQQLCDLHGEPQTRTKLQNTLKNRLLQIQVDHDGESKAVKVLPTVTVQKFKTMIAKQFKLNALNIELKFAGLKLDEPLRNIQFYNIQSGDIVQVL